MAPQSHATVDERSFHALNGTQT